MSFSDHLATRGAVSHLAALLGVAHTTVMRWRDGGIPAERVAEVAQATGIPAADLRPDLAAAFSAQSTHNPATVTSNE